LTGDIFSEIHRKSALLYIISRRTDVHCFSASVVKKKEIQTDGHHENQWLPSGKHTNNYGKSPFLIGKSTIDGLSIYSSWAL
jgi:hypothetical protein